jgi:hypothetical protein
MPRFLGVNYAGSFVNPFTWKKIIKTIDFLDNA